MLSAVRRESPSETALESTYIGYDLKARSSLEPPGYAYVDNDQIENDKVTFADYDDLFYEIRDEKMAILFKCLVIQQNSMIIRNMKQH
ncbi:hypothetical protein NSQ40_16945 [Bacillus sp. FSL K6-6038]|nr:hypothetical protein [Bacillus pseudomycoides]MCR8860505.1 hypothetical protein [Bacillus pseudomycoides]